jgi:hypothetical protein
MARTIKREGKIYIPKQVYETTLTAPSNANITTEYAEIDLEHATTSELETEITAIETRLTTQFDDIYRTVVPIGVWNMDADASITVAHGLDGSKIKNIEGYILADDAVLKYPSGSIDVATGDVQWMIVSWNATIVNLTRRPAGTFDAATFNDAVINRGDLIIDYVL